MANEVLNSLNTRLAGIERKTAVCTVSGGVDSTVAMAMMANAGFGLNFIFFDWGQKTEKKERECAEALAGYYGADLKIVEVPLLQTMPGVTLTQKDTQTVAINEYVPARNTLLFGQAIAWAEATKAGVVCVGSLGGDHNCPDNSPAFIAAMQTVINQGTMLKPAIQLIAPLGHTDKNEAVKIGTELGVPFELTWSCHNNTDAACGKCSNCEGRLEAFAQSGRKDPIAYAI